MQFVEVVEQVDVEPVLFAQLSHFVDGVDHRPLEQLDFVEEVDVLFAPWIEPLEPFALLFDLVAPVFCTFVQLADLGFVEFEPRANLLVADLFSQKDLFVGVLDVSGLCAEVAISSIGIQKLLAHLREGVVFKTVVDLDQVVVGGGEKTVHPDKIEAPVLFEQLPVFGDTLQYAVKMHLDGGLDVEAGFKGGSARR